MQARLELVCITKEVWLLATLLWLLSTLFYIHNGITSHANIILLVHTNKILLFYHYLSGIGWMCHGRSCHHIKNWTFCILTTSEIATAVEKKSK